MLILYVDDDKEDQEIFCDAIKTIDQSIECVAVNDGLQALTILSRALELPDFIFTDVNMPRMGGKMLLQNLKADPRFKNIPVVIISTGVHEDDKMEYIQLGAHTIFPKPTSFNELVDSLKLMLVK